MVKIATALGVTAGALIRADPRLKIRLGSSRGKTEYPG
jgi:hypothetical protein